MCPTQIAPVLSVSEGALCFRLMRWGLVPAWAKSVKDADKYSMINAKSEEVTEKRSFKNAFQKRRCIVPVSGFYEWKRIGESKQPFAIHLLHEPIISLAGIWERWENPEKQGAKQGADDGGFVDSFCLMTMAANSVMSGIHNRMPVILSKEEEQGWLNPLITTPKDIFPFMTGETANDLTAYEISPLVNSPKNNSPKVLEAINATK